MSFTTGARSEHSCHTEVKRLQALIIGQGLSGWGSCGLASWDTNRGRVGEDERGGGRCSGGGGDSKLQTLVYDILPSNAAVFSYAIGSRKLSADEQVLFVCCWCSNSSRFVTNK